MAGPGVAQAVSLQRDFQSRRFTADVSADGTFPLPRAPRRSEFRLQADSLRHHVNARISGAALLGEAGEGGHQ